MKTRISLALFAVACQSYAASYQDVSYRVDEQENQNKVEVVLSNEDDFIQQINTTRNQDYPTRIIRFKGNVEQAQISCEEVSKTVDEVFTKKIRHELFLYHTYISCGYDVNSHLAKTLVINSYFDPLPMDLSYWSI